MVYPEFLLYARLVAYSYFDRIRKRLAANVRKRRRELGLTQEQVAHEADMAARHFQKLEEARLNVTLRTIVKVARALKSELRDLF